MADLNTTVSSAEAVAAAYARALLRWHVAQRRERFLMAARVENPTLKADYFTARKDVAACEITARNLHADLAGITDGYAREIHDDTALVGAALAI